MFSLEKTRAAEYADLSSLDQPGFGLSAEPIACLMELAAQARAAAEDVLAQGGPPSFGAQNTIG